MGTWLPHENNSQKVHFHSFKKNGSLYTYHLIAYGFSPSPMAAQRELLPFCTNKHTKMLVFEMYFDHINKAEAQQYLFVYGLFFLKKN